MKSREEVLVPDSWWDAFALIDQGRIRRRVFDDHYEAIAKIELDTNVPESVKQQFDNARNVYLYSYFAHRMLMVAELQVWISVEFALRERAKRDSVETKEWWGLQRLMNLAIKHRWLADDGFEVFRRNEGVRKRELETLAQIDPKFTYDAPSDTQVYCKILAESFSSLRNTLAHGSNMLHPSVLGTFEISADLINQLFLKDSEGQQRTGKDRVRS